MRVEAIDHVHINVEDIKKAMRLFAALTGSEYPEPMVIEETQSLFAYNDLGLYLNQPLSEESPNARWIAKRGEGLAAISFGVKHLDGLPLSEKLASRCRLDAQEFDSILYASEWQKQAFAGARTIETMWANIGKLLGLQEGDLSELDQDYWAGQWNTPLLDYIRTLKPHYKLGIVSDAYPGARQAVNEFVNEELFDALVFSAEQGICKPDPRIFYIALDKLGVEADAAIFIDDRTENIEAAKQLGMHAILYENFPQLLDSLGNYKSVYLDMA